MTKIRLDALLQQRGLVESREQGRRLILAGKVLVNGQVVDKAGRAVDAEAEIVVRQAPPYVGRGGLKLAEALDAFGLRPEGCVVADVGSSTGGFTDCVLQRGASRVYAIDVGYGQLDYRLRQDARVLVMERTNARYLETLPEPIDLVTMDVSFISVNLILPQVRRWLRPQGHVVALIKPQFEAGRELVGKGGVIRDPETHRSVLRSVLTEARAAGFLTCGLIRSPITGAKGNIEFLAWLCVGTEHPEVDLTRAIEAVLERP